MLNTPKLKRRVESSRSFFTPTAFRVPLMAGWLEEQAEPEAGGEEAPGGEA